MSGVKREKLKQMYHIELGHKKDTWFICNWEGKILGAEYTIEKAKELLDYFKKER